MHNGLNPSSWVTVDGAAPAVPAGGDLDRPPDERCGRSESAGRSPATEDSLPREPPRAPLATCSAASLPRERASRCSRAMTGEASLSSSPALTRGVARARRCTEVRQRATHRRQRPFRVAPREGNLPRRRRPAGEVRPASRPQERPARVVRRSARSVRHGKVEARGNPRPGRHRAPETPAACAAMRRRSAVSPSVGSTQAPAKALRSEAAPDVRRMVGGLAPLRTARARVAGSDGEQLDTGGEEPWAAGWGRVAASRASREIGLPGSPSDTPQGAVGVGGLQNLEVCRRSARSSRGMRVPCTLRSLRQRRRPGERRGRRPWCPLRRARRRERASGSAGGSGPRRDAVESWRATVGRARASGNR